MDLRHQGPKLSLAVLGAALLMGALVSAHQEIVGRVSPSGDPAVSVAAVTAIDATVGLAIVTQRRALNVCYELLESIYALTRPTEQRLTIGDGCERLAVEASTMAPSSSFAWLVAAKSAAARNDFVLFNARLKRSQETGPLEQWVAEMRMAISETHFAALDADVLQQYLADIRMLVQTGSGVQALASRYLSDPDFRERVTAVVETLPPEQQQRFLENVTWLAYAPD